MTEEKIINTLKSFENLHDSNFENITYDVLNSEIQVILHALKWTIPSKEANFQPNKIHLTITFKQVKKVMMQEIFSWDFIDNAKINIVDFENERHFLFKDDEQYPGLEIICKDIDFCELKIK